MALVHKLTEVDANENLRYNLSQLCFKSIFFLIQNLFKIINHSKLKYIRVKLSIVYTSKPLLPTVKSLIRHDRLPA